MKYLLVCVAFLLCTLQGMDAEPDKQKMMEIGKKCQEETSATSEDVSALMEKRTPETTTGKCMIACVLKKSGVFTENGQYDDEANNKLMAENFDDNPEKLSKMKAISDACKSKVDEVNDDEAGCERAATMHACAMETAKEMGFSEEDA